MIRNISIFGTSSDAGKSTITFVIAKILQDLGIKTVPFKAQNVSNNAYVCDDGSEIAVAQYFQANVLNVETSYHLNPILIKSGKANMASLVVEGKVVSNKSVKEYYKDINLLKPAVKRCFEYLDSKYDCVVCEGAGSPVELNLMDKDLSNIYIADEFNTKIILVADIEKGGVFASIFGVYNLLPKKLRSNVIGVLINKFRGDMSLFDEGIKIIEEQFNIPVLGVLPYLPFNLGFEDSQSLKNYVQEKNDAIIKVAVLSYPHMSNYNDFEPLINDFNIDLDFIENSVNLDKYDMLILPGSKLVIKDLKWLKNNGLFKKIKEYKKQILGLCGGYEMMFTILKDNYLIENEKFIVEQGFGFIDDELIFQEKKILKKSSYEIFDCKKVKGFEIHHGISEKYPLFFEKENIKGTFIHGIFDNDNIRTKVFKQINKNYKEFNYKEFKKSKINDFVENMEKRIDTSFIIKNIK